MQKLSRPPLKTVLPAKGTTILIIGRERRFNRSLQELLVMHGYDCHTALTELDAVFYLNQCHFDLIILSFKMIETDDGQQLVAQIQKNRKQASKLIMLSNDAVFDKAIWAIRQGADDFFKVPYAPDELLLSIHKLLSREASKKDSQRSRNQLASSELLHRFIVDNSPDVIYLLNKYGQFTFFNKQVRSLLGFSRKELLGEHYTTLIHPEDLEKSRYLFSERRTGDRAAKNVELRLRQKHEKTTLLSHEKSNVYVEFNAIGVYKKSGEGKSRTFLGTYGVVRDISKRKQKEKQSYHQLYHDALTNLPNRILFQDRLRLALCQNRRNKQMLAVMFLDIDGFKGINDSFGHAWGDTLLQAFSVRLKSCLREGDTLARISGDEFTILIPEVSNRKGTEKIARKIIDEFKVPFRMENLEIRIGVSIGISLSPADSDSDEELIQKADWAMYHVKRNGKNGFMHYRESIRLPGDTKDSGNADN